MEMDKLIQIGEKLGLEGQKLLEFVEKQQKLEEERRRKEEEKEEKRRKLEEEKRREEEVIIGNVPDVRDAQNPDPSWQEACAMTTRSQAKKKDERTALKVPSSRESPIVDR